MPTSASATINFGGSITAGTNPSGLALTGQTSGFQIANFTNGTALASSTGYTAPVAGHQTALFSPILVGTNPSGLSNVGPVATLGVIVGGTGYTPSAATQVYTDVVLTSTTGTGANATADVTVTSGAVTAVTLKTYGSGYAVGDSLTVSAAYLGGTGSGFSVPVATITPTVYTTTVTIDGTPHTVSINGPSAQTVTLVVAAINTAIGAAGTAAIDGNGNLTITSATSGTLSTVIFVTGTLFPALTGFQYITAAVAGSGSTAPVTATITIDSTPHAFSVAQNTMTTFTDVVSSLQTAIGAAGTVAMGTVPLDTLSAGVITGGTGYVDGTYANVPLVNVTTTNPDAANAHATITVAAGVVTAVVLVAHEGIGYTTGDVLTALRSDIGGGTTGAGFSFVLTVTTTYSPDIKITSATTGNLSSVSIVDGTLFSTLAGFDQILPAHNGVNEARQYNAVIRVDSTSVPGAINKLGDITPGSGYVAGTYHDVPLGNVGGGTNGAQGTIVVSGISAGTSTVAVVAQPPVTLATLAGIAAGAYTFTANIDGAGAVTYTIHSTGHDTIASIAALMNTALGGDGYTAGTGATVHVDGNAFVFRSPTLGDTSSVVVTIPASSGADIFGAINVAWAATNTKTEVTGVNGVTSVTPTVYGSGYVIGNIATLGTFVAGSGGTVNGTYTGVLLSGGHGVGASANITVTGGVVTSVTLVKGGSGYVYSATASQNDVLTAPSTSIGGVRGFSVPVGSLSVSAVTATPLTGVFSTTGNGTGFSVPVISTSSSSFSVTVKETAIADGTFAAVISAINNAPFTPAYTATLTGGNIVITTTDTGPDARISVSDVGALFSSLTGYVGVEYSGASATAAVPAIYGVGAA